MPLAYTIIAALVIYLLWVLVRLLSPFSGNQKITAYKPIDTIEEVGTREYKRKLDIFDCYIVKATKGQSLNIELITQFANLFFNIQDAETLEYLPLAGNARGSWFGGIPKTGNYIVSICGSPPTQYTLTIVLIDNEYEMPLVEQIASPETSTVN